MTRKISNVVAENDEAKVVASGVTEPKKPRKNRVGKTTGVPGVTVAVKKNKEPKPPRNPFRRSQTSKLQLNNLQTGKRVESMTPRIEILRTRLDVIQKRLEFVSGKLRLVKEELAVRAGCTNDDTTVETKAIVDAADHDVTDTIGQECEDGSAEDSADNIELEDEVEDGMDVFQTPACV